MIVALPARQIPRSHWARDLPGWPRQGQGLGGLTATVMLTGLLMAIRAPACGDCLITYPMLLHVVSTLLSRLPERRDERLR